MFLLPAIEAAGAGLIEAGIAAFEGLAAESAIVGITAEELIPLTAGLRGAAASSATTVTAETIATDAASSSLGGIFGAAEGFLAGAEARWAGMGGAAEALGPAAEAMGFMTAPGIANEVLKSFKRDMPTDMKAEAKEEAQKRSFHDDGDVTGQPTEQEAQLEELEDVTKYFTVDTKTGGGYLPGRNQESGFSSEMSNGGTINNPGVEKDCYQINGGQHEDLFQPVRTSTHKYFWRNQVVTADAAANVIAAIPLQQQVELEFEEILEVEPNNWMQPVYRAWMHGSANQGTNGGYQAMISSDYNYAPSLTDIWAQYYKFTQVLKSEMVIEFIHMGGFKENHSRPVRLYRFDDNNDVAGEIPNWAGFTQAKAPLNMMHPRFKCISGIIGPGFAHGFASSGDDSAFMSSYKNSHTDTVTYSANTNVEDPMQDTKQIEWSAIGVAPNTRRRTSYYVSPGTNAHVAGDAHGLVINIRIMGSFTIAWRNTEGDTFMYTLNQVPMARLQDGTDGQLERLKLLNQVKYQFDPKYSVDYTKHKGVLTVLPDHVLQEYGLKRSLPEDLEHHEPQKTKAIEEEPEVQ